MTPQTTHPERDEEREELITFIRARLQVYGLGTASEKAERNFADNFADFILAHTAEAVEEADRTARLEELQIVQSIPGKNLYIVERIADPSTPEAEDKDIAPGLFEVPDYCKGQVPREIEDKPRSKLAHDFSLRDLVEFIESRLSKAERAGELKVWRELKRGDGLSTNADGCREVHIDYIDERIAQLSTPTPNEVKG